jgi:hypothetical protein
MSPLHRLIHLIVLFANFGVDMARRLSNALFDGRAPVKDHRIGFEKTLARF